MTPAAKYLLLTCRLSGVQFNFATNIYSVGGARYGNILSVPGATYTRAGAATALTTTGEVVNFAANTPRITDRGVLIEEARTNLILQSAAFDIANWAKTGTTILADNTTAPDGTATADKIMEVAAAATPRVSQAVTGNIGTTYTISFFAKSAERSQVRVVLEGSGNFTAYFNTATGAITGLGALSTATMTALTNGWYRCTVTWTAATTTLGPYIATAEGGTTIASGDDTKGIYLWGAQVEVGAFATSYIPTTATSATRGADVLTLAMSLPAYPLTLVVNATLIGVGTTNARQITVDDNTSSNRAEIYVTTTARAYMKIVSGNVDQADTGPAATVTVGTAFKAAMRAATDAGAISLNGAAVAADASVTLPAASSILRIGNIGSGQANAYIRLAHVLPYAATDAQLQALTT